MSARLSKRAVSSSLTKRPLPPTLASGRSRIWSPRVVMPSSSTLQRGYNARRRSRTCSACHKARRDSRVAMTMRSGWLWLTGELSDDRDEYAARLALGGADFSMAAGGPRGAAERGLAPARDLAADGRDMRSRRASSCWCCSARPTAPGASAPGARSCCRWPATRPSAPRRAARDGARRRHAADRLRRAGDQPPPLRRRRSGPLRADAGGVRPGRPRLAEPIVGFRLADFYAEYVNRAIEEGLARLKSPSRAGLTFTSRPA
jgi:hypothetical protein